MESAALEAASSSTRGSGWGRQWPTLYTGSAAPPRATCSFERAALRGLERAFRRVEDDGVGQDEVGRDQPDGHLWVCMACAWQVHGMCMAA